jgi:hypothetical protein
MRTEVAPTTSEKWLLELWSSVYGQVSGNGRTTRKEQETSKENVMTIVFLQNENRHQKFIS